MKSVLPRLADTESYTRWQAPHPLYTPWVGDEAFLRLYDNVESCTLVSRDRCYVLAMFAQYAKNLPGAFAEAGVYKGGTALLVSRVLLNCSKLLYLFDSFRGLPKESPNFDNYYKQGDFQALEADTRKY